MQVMQIYSGFRLGILSYDVLITLVYLVRDLATHTSGQLSGP